MACSSVALMVIRDSQRLFLSRLVDAPHFNLAAALHGNEKAKLLKEWKQLQRLIAFLSLGMRRFYFHRHQKRRVVGQAYAGKSSPSK